uniref:Trypanosoma Tc-38 (p38) protein domain-containing protein n=1 Tax=Trypanosoma congolense (strain IL3000) TaxID=1068625 RepID=G0ULY1_TRYCI|nr:conserved hypothetical protein [Trypanosoma congolense IL3000]
MRRRGHCSLLDIFVAFRSVGNSEGKGVSPFAFSCSHPTAFPSTVGTVQGELNVPTAHVATEIPSCDVVTRPCGGGGMREPVETLPPYYRPMSLRGVLYEGDLMRQLMEVAAMRHFRSPVWATSAAFTRAGYAVLDGEVGVDVCTCMQNVWLFNIQQTNAPESTPCTAASRLRGMPYNARGRPHSLHVRLVLEGHPSYRRFTSPYWVGGDDAVALGTAVRSEELDHGVPIPRRRTEDALPPADCDDQPSVSASSRLLVLYNAEQLENPDVVSSFACRYTECVNVDGKPYSLTCTICMRRYCEKHSLRTEPFAMFLTGARLRSLGGECIPDAAPPLTLVIKDDLITFYHADQTTIPGALLRRAVAVRRERLDHMRSGSSQGALVRPVA